MATQAMHFTEGKGLWRTSSTEPEVFFIAELNIIKEVRILFSLFFILLNLFRCQLAWVYAWSGFCMGTAEDSSLRFFVTMHIKVLGNIFGGTFSGSFQQNLSPHPHCQDIWQSTSCQIWDFLPSCWDYLLTRWLEICVSNGKFGFLRIIVKVKLPAKFCLHSFQWFCVYISSDTKYSFLSCPRHFDQELMVVNQPKRTSKRG